MVRQRSAKPFTPVRTRLVPPLNPKLPLMIKKHYKKSQIFTPYPIVSFLVKTCIGIAGKEALYVEPCFGDGRFINELIKRGAKNIVGNEIDVRLYKQVLYTWPNIPLYNENTLEYGEFSQWLSSEAQGANEIKNGSPAMVVIGNPPYSGISTNKGEWIMNKIEDYKYVAGKHFGERKHSLGDDYVKFIRYAEHYIELNKALIKWGVKE